MNDSQWPINKAILKIHREKITLYLTKELVVKSKSRRYNWFSSDNKLIYGKRIMININLIMSNDSVIVTKLKQNKESVKVNNIKSIKMIYRS